MNLNSLNIEKLDTESPKYINNKISSNKNGSNESNHAMSVMSTKDTFCASKPVRSMSNEMSNISTRDTFCASKPVRSMSNISMLSAKSSYDKDKTGKDL